MFLFSILPLFFPLLVRSNNWLDFLLNATPENNMLLLIISKVAIKNWRLYDNSLKQDQEILTYFKQRQDLITQKV